MRNNKKFTQDQSYSLYLEERKLLVDAEREEARTFDKAILTLASGAFGVSIAFLKNIVPNPFHNTLWLLGSSWILFALSLLVILSSFLTSQKACRLQVDVSYDELVGNQQSPNKWARLTEVLNYSSIGVLVLAFVFFGLFVYWNLLH